MSPKRNLDSFFMSQGQSTATHSQHEGRSVGASSRKKREVIEEVPSPSGGCSTPNPSSTQWMAVDERRQLELAMKLSLGRSSLNIYQSNDGDLPDYQHNRRREPEHPGEITKSKDSPSSPLKFPAVKTELIPTTPTAASNTVSLRSPQPAAQTERVFRTPPAPQTSSLAPLFMTSPAHLDIVSIPRPTFSDDDFCPSNKVQPLYRFSGSLDCLYYPSWISSIPARRRLREWMLSSLQWHRVCYIRPGTTFKINTPRFTTTFGMLEGPAARPLGSYKIRPKEIPEPLRELKQRIEVMQGGGVTYNSAIINYYANGEDSISYHSDDEAFLGPEPNIASLSLGATRDFYLRRKSPKGLPVPPATSPSGSKGVGPAKDRPSEKLQLSEGALLIMRGMTQAEWEHAIPKRKGVQMGRINITFRRAIDQKAVDNFTRYNRGEGPGYRWRGGRMVVGTGGI